MLAGIEAWGCRRHPGTSRGYRGRARGREDASSFLSRPSALMTRTDELGVRTPAHARKSRGGCWEKPRALAKPPRRMWGAGGPPFAG